MRRFVAAGLTLALSAFAPPQPEIDYPERAQQNPPKSWIPEKAPEKAPPVTLNATPKQPSDYRHSTELVCQGNGPQAVPKEFVEAYRPAQMAVQEKRFSDAIRFAEIAAQYAKGAREWIAIESIRILAFATLKNDDTELVASLEAVLASKGCLSAAQETNFRNLLGEARSRMATPR